MLAATIYLFGIIGNIRVMLVFAVVISLFLGIGGLMVLDKGSEEEQIVAAKYTKRSLIVMAVACILLTFLPSKEILAAMYIVPNIANSEFIQQVPPAMMDLLMQWIKALQPVVDAAAGSV